MDKIAKKVAQRVLGAAAEPRDASEKVAAWENLPEGWTQDSLDKMWESLTGDRKHKVTACIKKMDGKVDDPGAFCASLADKMEPGWREKEAVSRPAAKGKPALEALSDAWDLYTEKYTDEVLSALTSFNMVDIDDLPDYDPSYFKKLRKLENQNKRVEKSTYGWRSAFNYLLEGRDVDVSRMADSVDRTASLVQALHKDLKKFDADVKRKYPDVYKEHDLGWNISRAFKALKDTEDSFNKAVKLLKQGKMASVEYRVASAYLGAQDE